MAIVVPFGRARLARCGACKDLHKNVSNSGGKPRESLTEAAIAAGTDLQLFR
jgi:hypothetical protein